MKNKPRGCSVLVACLRSTVCYCIQYILFLLGKLCVCDQPGIQKVL